MQLPIHDDDFGLAGATVVLLIVGFGYGLALLIFTGYFPPLSVLIGLGGVGTAIAWVTRALRRYSPPPSDAPEIERIP